MEFLRRIRPQKKGRQLLMLLLPLGMLFLLLSVYFVSHRFRKEEEVAAYTKAQQKVFDETTSYLVQTLHSGEEDNGKVSALAVKNYDVVIHSDIELLNEDHTDMLQKNMREAVLYNVSGADVISEAELDIVSTGITEIILRNILSYMESVPEEERATARYKRLYESIKEQLARLKEKALTVTIKASVNDAYIDPEIFISVLHSMSDEELKNVVDELASGLGMTPEEINAVFKALASAERSTYIDGILGQDGAPGAIGQTGASGEPGIQGPAGEPGSAGEPGPAGPAGRDGATGATGARGATGAAGKDGKDGYTPQKGKDYMTPSDVETIRDNVITKLEGSGDVEQLIGGTFRIENDTIIFVPAQ